jgi:hypothetical protein
LRHLIEGPQRGLSSRNEIHRFRRRWQGPEGRTDRANTEDCERGYAAAKP